jgi:FMN reductase
MSRTIAVVTAGLSQPSSTRLLADRLAAATAAELAKASDSVDLRVVELRDHAHDLVNATLTGFAAPELQRALDAVAGADGVIAVTPIFNASYSGLFKSFFDVLEPGSLVDVPVLVAATGGTARHSLALEHAMRPLFAYLRAVVVPTAVFAASEDWAGGDAQNALAARIRRAASQLALLVEAREPADDVDPFEEPTPFSQLLAGG